MVAAFVPAGKPLQPSTDWEIENAHMTWWRCTSCNHIHFTHLDTCNCTTTNQHQEANV